MGRTSTYWGATRSAIFMLLFALPTAFSSESCLLRCEAACSEGSDDRTFVVRLLLWSCNENCRYRCMHENLDFRLDRGLPIVRYFGKWPFIRVLGCQEIASVVFSIANAVPHYQVPSMFMCVFMLKLAQYLRVYASLVPKTYPLRNLWLGYALVCLNTWLWSAVFHARDCVLTERLDYFSASLSIVYALGATLIRMLNVHHVRHQLLVMAPCLLALLVHIAYLQFVSFDYGFNMRVSVATALTYCLLWIGWSLWFWSSLPHARKVFFVATGLIAAASLELYDFPPLFGIFDAHALWHGLTPFLSWLFWSFLTDDALSKEAVQLSKLK